MSAEPQTEIVAALEESRRLFDGALTGVADSDASRTPAGGGWTVLGIVEHLVGTEGFAPVLFSMGRNIEGGRRDAAREREITTLVLNRERRIEAPERVHPTGKFTNLDDARKAFDETRAATIQFAKEKERVLDTTLVTHPLLGEMTMRQLLVLVAGHSTRHIPQIDKALGRV